MDHRKGINEMAYTNITAENATNFPAGSIVEFNYGPMHGSERGTVTGFQSNRFGTTLTAITEAGEQKTISGFSTIGVGVYLIEVAAPRVNKSSPWYVAA
jgi:hypothetical protein